MVGQITNYMTLQITTNVGHVLRHSERIDNSAWDCARTARGKVWAQQVKQV